MKKSLLFMAALFPVAAAAQTSGCNPPVKMNGRLAIAPYSPTTLYECILSPDIATSIVAHGAEQIGPAGAADPTGLKVSKAANLLLVQPEPSEINRSPNVTFITKLPDGSTRSYFFLFHVAQYGGVPGIQLIYPEEEAKAKRELMAQGYAPSIGQVAASTLRTAPFYSPRPGGMNWKYSCMCDSWPRARPDISDNGQNTIVSFKGSVPADFVISRLDRDGTEKPGELPKRATVVNFTPLSTGGPLIIPEVAEYWRVLSGNEVAAWRNDAYHPEQIDVRSGTQSPYVVRTVRPTPAAPPKQPPMTSRPQTTASAQ